MLLDLLLNGITIIASAAKAVKNLLRHTA